jgi:PAS domain S-box-containing protein
MHDPSKTYQELIEENSVLKQKIRELKQSEVKHKQAEEKLRNGEELYRKITKCSPDLIWTMDFAGQFTYVNEAVERTHGWTVDEWLKLNTRDVVSPQQFAKNAALIEKEFMKATDPQYDRNTIFSYESEEVRKDGSIFWAEINATSLWSEDGMPTGIIGITRDITERKRAAEAIKKSELKYRNIFENAIEGVYQATIEGRFITANAALARMAGYDSPEELIESVKDIGTQLYVHPEDRKKFMEIMKAKGFVEGFECEFYKKDGSKLWAVINARTVKDEQGKILYFEGLIEDINIRKYAEKQLQQTLESLRKVVGTTGFGVRCRIQRFLYSRSSVPVCGPGLCHRHGNGISSR